MLRAFLLVAALAALVATSAFAMTGSGSVSGTNNRIERAVPEPAAAALFGAGAALVAWRVSRRKSA
jgi:hypothetical protein